MERFQTYSAYLESLVQTVVHGSDYSQHAKAVDDILDGQPARELRNRFSSGDLRAAGAFFTGSDLSSFALRELGESFEDRSVILDPACGVGDLLIHAAAYLPVSHDLEDTLKRWGNRIVGCDIYPEFVRAAKARLTLAAIRAIVTAGGRVLPINSEPFPNLMAHSGLTDYQSIRSATHIILNPPFTMVPAQDDCSWASGNVNAAALFLEACVLHAKEGTRIVAILPDVLRSGSRYAKWREVIEARSKQDRIDLYGQFSRWADVDVFVLQLTVREAPENHGEARWEQPTTSGNGSVADRFDVCVGPVVDYRDPHEGALYPFVVSRDLPSWQIVRVIAKHRRFAGRVLTPPFVVVRRTSRPGDKYRAIGTIIDCESLVAVENHLLALLPLDGKLETCQELLTQLQKRETTVWLDKRIRCRHLTVSSVRQIPWWVNKHA